MEETVKTVNLVLVTHHDNGKLSLKHKRQGVTSEVAQAEKKRLEAHAKACHLDKPDYRILDQKGMGRLYREIDANVEKRVAAGRVRAKAQREKNKMAGKKPQAPKHVPCPRCSSKTSKVLHSEFGGLQTRKCKNGHQFSYDKWIADRPLLGLFQGVIASPYRAPR